MGADRQPDPAGHLDAEVRTGPSILAGLLVSNRNDRTPRSVEHLRAGRVLTRVYRQAKLGVGVDGVDAAILQLVSAQLAEQPDAAALVTAQVQHDAPALGRDRCHGGIQLRAAVAAV